MSASAVATNANQELVDRVVEVTGSNQAEAEHLLAACANNVEAAVALFFEQGSAGVADAPLIPLDEEDDVRAPIAPIREQLIGPEDDNFFTPGRLVRAPTRVKVCPLRDFAREGALMEEQLHAAAASMDSSSSSSGGVAGRSRRRARAAAMVNAARAMEPKTTSSRLGDLFRPPTDIAYAGTFQTARLRATELKHWLLVNVQSDSFESQVLNRDVWSDKEVRKLIRRQFMLWQVDSDTSEGRRFVAFYHCAKLPYVCVIDPRTGEEIWKNAEPKQCNVLHDLQQFLRDHKDFSLELADDCPTTSKRSTECISIDDDDDAATAENNDADKAAGNNAKRLKRDKVVELTEEEQIALAIRNSMRENGAKKHALSDDDTDDDYEKGVNDEEADAASVEEFVDDDTKSGCEKVSYEEYLGLAKHQLTMLKLRLLNAESVDEAVQLRWPSDTKLLALRMYIAQHYPHLPKQGYKLICAYPRKTLETADNGQTLQELSLHPSANLHVTLDD